MAIRRNVTSEMIDRVFPNGELRGNDRLQSLFGSGNLVIIRHLLANGHAPTADQLSGLHGRKIMEAQTMDLGESGGECS